MINISDVWFQYPGADAPTLRGVSLAVGEGEFLGVLGPNGCGKSTLALLLNGLHLPTQGRVQVDGADTADDGAAWAIRRAVQIIFQNPENQIVGTTLAEDVAFGLCNIGLLQAEMAGRIAWALGLVGLADRADESPLALSGGEKQKLAAASALALGPRYLVLDEATAMLDPASRRSFLTALHDLRRRAPFGLIYITHHVEEVLGADRVVVMDAGQVRFEGTPVDALQHPDLLEACGVEVPYLAALAGRLRRGGLTNVPPAPTVDELVASLCD